jgi:hypothetical protein
VQIVVGEIDSAALEAFVAQFRDVFPRHRAGVRNGTHSLLGLVSDLPRKNAARMAEVLPGATLEQLPPFLVDCPWEAGARGSPPAGRSQGCRTARGRRGRWTGAGWSERWPPAGRTRRRRGGVSTTPSSPRRARTRGGAGALLRGAGQDGHLPGRGHGALHRPVARLAGRHAAVPARAGSQRPHAAGEGAGTGGHVLPDEAGTGPGAARPGARRGGAHAAVTADSASGDLPDVLAGLEARDEPYVVPGGRTFGGRLPEAGIAAARPVPPGRRPGRRRKDGTVPDAPHGPSGRPRITPPHPVRVAPRYGAEARTAAVPGDHWEVVTVRDGDGGAPQRLLCRVRAHRAQGDVTGPQGGCWGSARCRLRPQGP